MCCASFVSWSHEVTFVRCASCGQLSTLGEVNSFEVARKWRKTPAVPTNSIVPPSFVETLHGNLSPWSFDHIRIAKLTCFRLLTQFIRQQPKGRRGWSLGRNKPASTATTTIETSTSTNVSPPVRWFESRRFISGSAVTPFQSTRDAAPFFSHD